jgi:hypothetical protein
MTTGTARPSRTALRARMGARARRNPSGAPIAVARSAAPPAMRALLMSSRI